MTLFGKILKIFGALDEEKQSVKVIHPLGFIAFLLSLPVIIIISIFVTESAADIIRTNYHL